MAAPTRPYVLYAGPSYAQMVRRGPQERPQGANPQPRPSPPSSQPASPVTPLGTRYFVYIVRERDSGVRLVIVVVVVVLHSTLQQRLI